MLGSIFLKGRRLFSATAIVALLTTAMHLFGNLQPMPPELEGVVSAMQGPHFPMGLGMSPSMYDIYWLSVFSVAVTLAGMGVMGLVLATTSEATNLTLSRAAAVFATMSAAMATLAWVAQFPPALISMTVLTVLWTIAMRTTRFA